MSACGVPYQYTARRMRSAINKYQPYARPYFYWQGTGGEGSPFYDTVELTNIVAAKLRHSIQLLVISY